MKTEQISIRLTTAQLQAIDDIATRTVGERSDHIRKALDLYIDQNSLATDEAPLTIESARTMLSTELSAELSRYSDDDGDPYPAYLIE